MPLNISNFAADQNDSVSQPGELWTPADNGFVAWNMDPAVLSGSNATPLTSGTIVMLKLPVRQPLTQVTNILAIVSTAGGTLTGGQNLAGLYDATGKQLGVTADQSASWVSTGLKIMPLVTPVAVPFGQYYIAVMSNGTTPICMARGSGFGLNGNLPNSALRFATGPVGQTSLPASITLASNANLGVAYWAGLS